MCWKTKVSALFRSFGFAGQGIAACFAQRNFRIHTVAVVYVTVVARYFLHTPLAWAVLLITFGLVLFAEAVNTAIEAAVDLISPDVHPLAKRAKDVAAGAVLITAIMAVGVAVCLFWSADGWRALWTAWTSDWWRLALILVSIPLAAVYVFYEKGENK